ncbi:related to glycerate dehydrogenase [Rhynchosporium secalis]|uniref:Related to glycerate dehydrogenase n=1 Tax=Rhynchosporium secalis TaxID=38038 RepID=A0A1E1M255_RHYSE|nr:related to glycerate dehydrogenase [Rhynchosporium secalis]
MGEAPPQEKEFILIIIPFPLVDKVKGLLNSIRRKHHHVEIEYRFLAATGVDRQDVSSIPKGSWKKATILVTFNSLPPSLDLVPNLKLLHLFSAGANHIFHTPLWKDTDITITNSSGVHSPQIAEWVMLQILAHSHQEKILLEWQKQHKWGQHSELNFVKDGVGQRLGVLGYGAIGRQTARICSALGMDVIAYTASPRTTLESKKDVGYIVPGTGDPDGLIPSAWYSGVDKSSLHNFLKQDIDVLLIAVPLTPATTHFLGAEELAILGKRNAFIVNIARGAILKQDDLIAALKKPIKEGGLRGAALDVTDPEPLPKESELWDLENVVVTPHISGLGTHYVDRSFDILEKNLSNLETGKKLLNVVSRGKGY